MVLVYRGRKGMAWWSVLVPGGERMWQRLFPSQENKKQVRNQGLDIILIIHIDCTTIESIDLQHNNYMKNKPSNHEHIKEISGSNLNKDPLKIRLCVLYMCLCLCVCMFTCMYVKARDSMSVQQSLLPRFAHHDEPYPETVNHNKPFLPYVLFVTAACKVRLVESTALAGPSP